MFQAYKDIDGDTQQIYMQTKGSSCGPACIATIAKNLNKSVGDDWVGSLIDKRIPTITQPAGRGHDWNTAGTFHVQEALRKVGMKDTYTDKTGNFERAFKRCTKSKPGMSFIRFWQQTPDTGQWFTDWNTSFMHWVVIAGTSKTDPSKFIVMDPAVGISAQPYADLPYYKAPVGRDGVFSTSGEFGIVTTS